MPIARLDRSIIRLSGTGVTDWLSGLVTNAISNEITFAALLTPQGKIIADFFITKDGDGYLLDTPSKFGAGLIKRLKMYRLRAPIEITDLSQTHNLYAMWDGEGDVGVNDPRQPALGKRLISEDVLTTEHSSNDYDAHRLSLGIPDSQWDFETASVFPADAYMDMLSGVDFKKGCFIGQEVVSRMKRMTTVKKRMRGILLEGAASAGDKVLSGDRVIGDVMHVNGQAGVAMIRLDRLKGATMSLTLNGSPVAVMGAPDGSNT